MAPYEADAQLAFLEREGLIDAIITEDSDLLVFGCKTVSWKWPPVTTLHSSHGLLDAFTGPPETRCRRKLRPDKAVAIHCMSRIQFLRVVGQRIPSDGNLERLRLSRIHSRYGLEDGLSTDEKVQVGEEGWSMLPNSHRPTSSDSDLQPNNMTGHPVRPP